MNWCIVALLLPLLGWACVSDVRSRRIPNAAVVAIAVAGVATSLLSIPALPGAVRAFEGMGIGFAVWFPFYALGMLGAGDVKLFAAAAAWLGPRGALQGALLAALVGGVLAIVFLLAENGVVLTSVRLGTALRSPNTLREATAPRSTRVPYALAISAGVLAAAYFPGLLS